MFFNSENDAPARSPMNGRQKLLVIATDVCIVVELCVAMAQAATVPPEVFTPTFMKTFFTLFLPTLLLGFLGVRRLRDRPGDA